MKSTWRALKCDTHHFMILCLEWLLRWQHVFKINTLSTCILRYIIILIPHTEGILNLFNALIFPILRDCL